jgi:hypothetical protein
MEEKKSCEHELSLISEYWISESSVQVDAECSKCNQKFSGVLFVK